jgi:hypothetical protein
VSDTGFVRIAGEVVNETGQWLQLASVDVVLLDAEGKAITVDSIAAADGHGESALIDRGYIPPGERSFFTYLRDAKKLARPYASHKLAPRARLSPAQRDATLEGLTVKKVNRAYLVSGTLRSSGALPCYSPSLAWGKIDESGLVIDSSFHSVDAYFQKELAPGQSVAVEAKVHDHVGEVAEIRAYGTCAHSD